MSQVFTLILDGFEVPYKQRWPEGEEKYDGAIRFRARINDKVVPVIIAFGYREAFGAVRRRVLIIVKNKVMLELAGVDDYDWTGLLVGVLKKPGTEEHFRPGEEVPRELSRFTIVTHRDYIRKGGFYGLAVLFSIADVKGMAEYGLVRAKLEGII